MRAFFLMQKTLKTKLAPFSIRLFSSFTAPLGRLETASASALRQHLLAPRFLDRLSQSAPCSSEDCEARAKSWSELGDFSLGSKGISGGTSVLVLMLTLLVININTKAVELESVAGAYWRGDEKRPMLQRIYGTAWENEEQLKAYIHFKEEAKHRDHRRLGQDLNVFSIQVICGCAVGVAVAFRAPCGGVLFALDEVTSW